MTGQPRIGFCCKFVPPDGDKVQTKLMNLTSTTIAALMRRDRNEAFEKLLAIVRHNMEALERQLLWVAHLPPLERMFRIQSGVLPAYAHEVGRVLYAEPLMRRTIEHGLARAGKIARMAGVRVSMHPGQFCILATASEFGAPERGR